MSEISDWALRNALYEAEKIGWRFEGGNGAADLAWIISAYLAALPESEPHRDCIAVVAGPDDAIAARYMDAAWEDQDWGDLEAEVRWDDVRPQRTIVRCTVARPEPRVTVEVEGAGVRMAGRLVD